MTEQETLAEYCLRLGDNGLILGHRLSEWCGHGPVLEEDIAMANMSLDLIGQARGLLGYAAKLKGEGNETSQKLGQLKMEAEDGKMREIVHPARSRVQTLLCPPCL